jgi:hypothetical protein
MKNFFCRPIYPTPILNRPDFSTVFGGHPQGVLLDEHGLLSPLETIAFVGEPVQIIHQHHDNHQIIYEIKLESYHSSKPLYVDARFVEVASSPFSNRMIEKPKKENIILYMQKLIGYPYVWGGNWSQGIEQMPSWYPIHKKMTTHEKSNWMMQGVDCSGLLYEATNGFTPRNTSELIYFGNFLDIAGKNPKQIASLISPLDLIVWKGHVIIALDQKYTIESRARRGGVIVTDLVERLEQILYEDKKKPASFFTDNHESYYIKTGWI